MNPIVVVLLNGLNFGDLSDERQIHYVGSLSRPKAHAIAALQFHPVHLHAFEKRSFFERVPFLHTYSVPAARARGLRSSPSRGSARRISSFSASDMVRTRSVRISSISVPSKRSPGLSSAICG